jgi:predicted alpha/beta-fold hydrolase
VQLGHTLLHMWQKSFISIIHCLCIPVCCKHELHTLLTAAHGLDLPCHICHAGQAYELLQGNLVRFSTDATTKDVPTAVLVHGILGSKRNLNSFARMIVEVSSS